MRSKKSLWLMLFMIGYIIFEEIIFSISAFGNISIYTILLSIPIGGILYLLTNFLKEKVNHVFVYILFSLITILFAAQLVYYDIYQSVISFFSIVNGGGQVLQFYDKILSTIMSNAIYIILLFVPLITFIVMDVKKFFDYRNSKLKKKIILFISLICFNFAILLSMKVINTNELYSNENLYYNVHAPLLTTNKMGIVTMMRLDLQRLVFGFEDKDIEIHEEEKEKIIPETKYNVMKINFDDLISKGTNETIKSIDEYINNQNPSKQNEYTGMFKGKNLVVFVAEAFSELAIDKNLTPTLYKLYNEGFQFDNFYTPVFPVSTADGEYITDTSLIPKEGVWSLFKVKDNYMPFSYANMFENLGYSSNAYHDNTATYYKRSDYIKAMGYNSFKACGAGLDINCRIWPESDLEMIQASTNDYINNDKFLAYYMTVSGHLEYTRNGNMMVSKNWDAVKNLNYSNKAKSYLSCNIEFDKALEELIKRLKTAGKLDDTVIAISGDHYPYGLSVDEINELSTYQRNENFEIHAMPFLVWNSTMKKPVKVTKIGSSLDVLPTLMNLFGMEYDSRLMMGRDILSDSDSLVIFSNRSFITEKGRYNSITKQFTPNKGIEVEDDYVNKVSSIIYNKYKYSRLILENDYYRKLYTRLGWTVK